LNYWSHNFNISVIQVCNIDKYMCVSKAKQVFDVKHINLCNTPTIIHKMTKISVLLRCLKHNDIKPYESANNSYKYLNKTTKRVFHV